MANTNHEINAFIEASKKALAPAVRFNELSAKAFERVARLQYDALGDFLNYGLAHLHLGTSVKDVPTFVQKSTELTHQFVEKQTQRSQELLKVASESQADFTQWMDKTTAEVAAKTAKFDKAA